MYASDDEDSTRLVACIDLDGKMSSVLFAALALVASSTVMSSGLV